MNVGKYDKLLLIVLLISLIIGTMKVSKEHRLRMEALQIEISNQEIEIEKLFEIKEIYESLIADYELENQKIDLIQDAESLIEENEHLRMIRARLTAYSPLDNIDGNQAMGDPTKTSRGKTVGRYYAAADPKKLPYGTILEIPNYGIVEIQDTGSALRKDNKNIRVDLFHDTYAEAMKFGVQDKDIKILKWGK